jgi:hypothetical protein
LRFAAISPAVSIASPCVLDERRVLILGEERDVAELQRVC